MSDEEVICTWIGWSTDTFDGVPPAGHLHLLWEVEERLTDEQWHGYAEWFRGVPLEGHICTYPRICLHATAERKIAALAAVLRPTVEGKCAE